MGSWHVGAFCAAVLTVNLSVAATPADTQQPVRAALVGVAQDLIYTSARLYPMQATESALPVTTFELEAPSEAFRAARVARLQQWKDRVEAIIAGFDSRTTLVDRDDAALLRAQLLAALNALEVYQFDRKDYSAAANNVVNALFVQFQHLPLVGKGGATADDQLRAWSDIVSRLNATPAYITAATRLVTKPCHLCGVVGSKQLAGAPAFLKGALTEATRSELGADSVQYARFLKARDAALVAIRQLKAFIDAHVSAWPDNFAMGREAYDRMLREEQLLPFNATDVEAIGRDELAHGWAEEAWLQDLARRKGTPLGAASGGGLAPGGAELIGYYRECIAELRKFITDQDVVTIPSWLGTMQVMETPAFMQPVSPGASMNPPRLSSSSTTGYYFITPPKSHDRAVRSRDRAFARPSGVLVSSVSTSMMSPEAMRRAGGAADQ
jgi:Bacterial protein of unknown function (DUF885)